MGGTNTHTGNKLSGYPIVGWGSRGLSSVELNLYHNSQVEDLGGFGYGWTHSYSTHILYTSGNPTATVVMPDGLEVPFTLVSGVWAHPAGFFATLVKNVGGDWTLTMKDQTVMAFDSAGKLTSVTDRFGNATTVAYSGTRPMTVTSADGRVLAFGYTSYRITSVTDPEGRVWGFNYTSGKLMSIGYPHEVADPTPTRSFTYDGAYNILTETDLNGKVWSWTYSTNKMASFTDPTSRTTSYSYGPSATTITLPGTGRTIVHNYSAGTLASEVDEAGFSDANVYDADLNVTGYTDKRGKIWGQSFDSNGNVLILTNPLSKVWTFTYTGVNDLATKTDPLSNVTAYTYSLGRLTKITDDLGHDVITRAYDIFGDIVTNKDALSRVTTYAYSSQGDLVSVTDPAGVDTTAAYDGLGRIEWVKDDALNQTSISYTPQSQILSVIHPGGASDERFYDGEGRVTKYEDEIGRTTLRTYDDAGRVIEEIDGNGDDEDYTYNTAGFLASTTDGNGHVRSYVRTLRGEAASLGLADGSIESWSYDGEANITQQVDALSRTTSIGYDDAGHLASIDRPINTDVFFFYDDAGRRTGMTDSTGTTSWAYDDSSRVTQLIQPYGRQTYAYNNADQRTSMTEWSGLTNLGSTSYVYGGSTGRLDSITNRFSQSTAFAYDSLGRISVLTHHNGVYETTTYDSRSRTDTITLRKPDTSVIRTHTYSYDNASQITSHQIDANATTYSYDGAGQLTSEGRTGYAAVYSYDGNYNRVSRTVGGVTQTYSYDSGDKLQTVKVGSTTIRSYIYNAVGQPTGVSETAGTATLAWDDSERLASLTPPGTAARTNSYNAYGARVSADLLAMARDGVGVTAPVLRDGVGEYTPGIADRRSGVTRYQNGDALSLDVQTSSTAGVTSKRTYDAFGNLDSSTGGTWMGSYGFAGAFGYQTDGSGLQLLGHRWYDADAGRFLTRDPIKDGRNWYAYCENDPVNGVDPDGQKVKFIVGEGMRIGDVLHFIGELGRVRGTKRGSQLLQPVLDPDGPEYTIELRPGRSPGLQGSQANHPKRYLLLYMENGNFQGPPPPDSSDQTPRYYKFSLARVFAHELGHMVDDLKDDGKDQMDNVNKSENPVAVELGEYPRISY